MKGKKLEIATYGNEILKKPALPVTEIDNGVLKLCREMAATMRAAKGVGLAAPQVGVSKRIIVVLPNPDKDDVLVVINPEILACEGEMMGEEGCLSLPGITAEVKRYAKVLVKGLNKKGEPFEMEGIGLLSRIFQHEIDHLNGTLFVDRISFVRKKLLSKKLKQLKKETLAKLTEG